MHVSVWIIVTSLMLLVALVCYTRIMSSPELLFSFAVQHATEKVLEKNKIP